MQLKIYMSKSYNKKNYNINKKQIIFTFNGGGTMGQNSVQIYQKLEEKVLALAAQKNLPLTKLSDAITCFGGTSIGAFNAAMLAKNANSSELFEMYKAHSADIFKHQKHILGGVFYPKYNRDGMDKVAQKYFDNVTKIHDLEKYIVIPSFSLTRGEATIWTNCINRDIGNKSSNFYSDYFPMVSNATLLDAVKASGAAPILFEAATVSYDNSIHKKIDGGIFANNPTPLTLEVLEKHLGAYKMHNAVVVNIGAGCINTKLQDQLLTDTAYGGLKAYFDNKYIFGVISNSHDQFMNFMSECSVYRNHGKYFTFQPEIPSSIFGPEKDEPDDIINFIKKIKDYLNKDYVDETLNIAAKAILDAYADNILVDN